MARPATSAPHPQPNATSAPGSQPLWAPPPAPPPPRDGGAREAVFVVLPDGSIRMYDPDWELTAGAVLGDYPDHRLGLSVGPRFCALAPASTLSRGATYYLRRHKKPPSPKPPSPEPTAGSWATSEAVFSHLVVSGRANRLPASPAPDCHSASVAPGCQNAGVQSQRAPRLARHSSLNLSHALQAEARSRTKERLSYGALGVCAPTKPPHGAPRHTPALGLSAAPHTRPLPYESLEAALAPAPVRASAPPMTPQPPTAALHRPGIAAVYLQGHARYQRAPTATQDSHTSLCWQQVGPRCAESGVTPTAANGACLLTAAAGLRADPPVRSSTGPAGARLHIPPAPPATRPDAPESPRLLPEAGANAACAATGAKERAPGICAWGAYRESRAEGMWSTAGEKPMQPAWDSKAPHELAAHAGLWSGAEALMEPLLLQLEEGPMAHPPPAAWPLTPGPQLLLPLEEGPMAGGLEVRAQRSSTCPDRTRPRTQPPRSPETSPRVVSSTVVPGVSPQQHSSSPRLDRECSEGGLPAQGVQGLGGDARGGKGGAPVKSKLRTIVRRLSRWGSLPAGGIDVSCP